MEPNEKEDRMVVPASAASSKSTTPTIIVAALCGSLRKASFNRGLIRCATELCDEFISGMRVEHIDAEHLPFINTDLEAGGTFPPAVEAFCRKIRDADCILFATPEYNYSVRVSAAAVTAGSSQKRRKVHQQKALLLPFLLLHIQQAS